MKAAVLEATRTMVCKEVATPAPAAGEVLVKVAYCGICGSDVPRYLDGAVHGFPIILGHEFSGKVVDVGDGVDAGLMGRRVSCIPLIPCMECPDCTAGNYSLCKQYGFIGSRQSGAYAEFVALPANNVYPLPDGVSYLEGAFFEPATVAQHAIDLASPAAPANAAILGCGTIGIFLAQILQSLDLNVDTFLRNKTRISAAKSAGITSIVDTSEDGWEERVLSRLPKNGYDYVFDTSGNAELMVKSFGLVGKKGTICMVGTPKRPMEFSVREWENLNRKEMKVIGSWMSYSAPFPGREWEEVARNFENGHLKITDEMIDSVYTLEEIPVGIQKFDVPNSVTGKLLIKCTEED